MQEVHACVEPLTVRVSHYEVSRTPPKWMLVLCIVMVHTVVVLPSSALHCM